MKNIVVRSIFHTTVAERSWKTHTTSAILHIALIAGAFLITFPVVHEIEQHRSEHVTLVAPIILRPHTTIEPPKIPLPAKIAPLVPPPLPTPKPEPKVVAKIILPPVINPVPKPPEPHIEAEPKPLPPAPKPEEVRAKAAPAPKVVVGGFGDLHGMQAAEKPKPQPVILAEAGKFDAPVGPGQSGGGGNLSSGVKQTSFGNAGDLSAAKTNMPKVRTAGFGDTADASTRSNAGVIRSAGFGDTVAPPASQKKLAPVMAAAFTPVEILFKPRPSYSAEARNIHLEGQVSLEVVFQASGELKVVRVIKGLGHGLDEAAQQAALRVRFKPATRGGAAVDTNGTISITFELT